MRSYAPGHWVPRGWAMLARAALALVLASCSPLSSSADPMHIEDVLRSHPDGAVRVSGFVVRDSGGPRLCSELLESFPPQCGGPSLALAGFDPGAVPDLVRDGETFWTSRTVEVTGTLSGDTFTVTGYGS